MTQSEFAKALGLSLRGYQNYERGERAPSDDLIRAAWSTFGIDPVWLLTGEGDMFRMTERPAGAEAPAAGLSPQEEAVLTLYRALDIDAQREIRAAVEEKKRLREVERKLKDLQADLAGRKRSA